MRQERSTYGGWLFSWFLFFALTLHTAAAMGGEKSTWQIIKERGYFNAGVAQADPLFRKDPVTGQWSGLGVSLARALANAMGLEVRLIETTWGNAIAALQAHQIDTIFGLTPTPSRAMVIDFIHSQIYYSANAILLHSDKNVHTWKDLHPLKIAVIMGAATDLYISRQLPKATIQRYPNISDAMAAFQSGRADCFLGEHMPLIRYKKKLGKGKIVLLKPVRYVSGTAGVRREADKTWRDFLNTSISYYYMTGKLQQWYEESLIAAGIDPGETLPIVKEMW